MMRRLQTATLIILLSPLISYAQKPSIETVRFRSKLIDKALPYNVILPPDYHQSRATRYPVLYLLHGVDGHYSDWVTRTNVADYAAQYRMIVVTPEGNNSWYTNSAGITTDKYESYLLTELIPDVQGRYRTIESRYGRGIAGLSMGGYGAVKFALKSPGTFTFAGSMSGTLAVTNWSDDFLRKTSKSIQDSTLGVFGPTGSETRRTNDLFQIVQGLTPARVAALPYFYVDCGTDDFSFADSNQFVALLREKKIPHEYRELPGNHNWEYWDQQVREVLKIASQRLRIPAPVRKAKVSRP